MLKGATIVWGYETNEDVEVIFAEERIYLIDDKKAEGENEDGYWEAIYDLFRPLYPKEGSTKIIMCPLIGKEIEFSLFQGNIRTISKVSVCPEPIVFELTSPLFVTSHSYFFNNRANYLKYADGINVDVENDEPIDVQVVM